LCSALDCGVIVGDACPYFSMLPLTRYLSFPVLTACVGMALVAGCSSTPQANKPRVAGTAPKAAASVVRNLPANSQVLVYASPVTEAAYARAGASALPFAQHWVRFLQRYQIVSGISADVADIEQFAAPMLILPSASHLSAREMAAVTAFRARGGSILATGAAGVYDEREQGLGYGFMEKTLGVGVAGTTENEVNDTFLMPYGSSPVSHALPAGQRVWLARVKDHYPLRLTGGHPAAIVMDWSRSAASDKPATLITFDEQGNGESASRVVVFGFSEKLWDSADPRAIDALAHNAVTWLLRVPAATLSAWPHPYMSGMVVAVDIPDSLVDVDLALPAAIAGSGARASYFLLAETAAESIVLINRLYKTEHDISLMGDRFEAFKNQAAPVQRKRIQGAITTMQQAGIRLDPGMGMHPPMESMDETTIKSLRENNVGYVIGGPDVSEARLPFFATAEDSKSFNALVVLPRTLSAPEDTIGESDPVGGLKTFLREMDLAHASGSLSVLRLLGQNILEDKQLSAIQAAITARRNHTWIATGRDIASWWRLHAQVKTSLDTTVNPPKLIVTLGRAMPVSGAPAIWVTLPRSGAKLAIRTISLQAPPKVAAVDNWRAAILLDGLAPGTYRWELGFTQSSP
jgi:hypothetical protein